VMKGGNTEAGARTAASHTNALVGAAEAWDGLLRQAGAIRVSNLEELVDVIVTFLYLPVPKGRRLGSIGVGGGATVLAADSYPSAGFVLPPLPQEMQRKLRNLTKSDAGLTLDNPVDFSSQYFTPAIYTAVRALADYDGFDMLIFHLPFTIIPPVYSVSTEAASSLLDDVIRVRRETNKPLALVISNFVAGESWQTAFYCAQKCSKAGIPVYFYIGSAAKAIDRFLRYHERRARLAV